MTERRRRPLSAGSGLPRRRRRPAACGQRATGPAMKRSREGGWVLSEVVFTMFLAIALAALVANSLAGMSRRAEARQKAAGGVTHILDFTMRAQAGRDGAILGPVTVDLPGPDMAILTPACALDTGDITGTVTPGAEFDAFSNAFDPTVRLCAPCNDPGAPAVNTVACVAATATLPRRCGTQHARLTAVAANYASTLTAPTTTELMQGIWIPADSAGDAFDIDHQLQTALAPQRDQFPMLTISRTATGILICL